MLGLSGHLLVGGASVGDGPQPAAGEDVEAEVAAAFGPLVLLGQHGAHEADERVPVGEIPVLGTAEDRPHPRMTNNSTMTPRKTRQYHLSMSASKALSERHTCYQYG